MTEYTTPYDQPQSEQRALDKPRVTDWALRVVGTSLPVDADSGWTEAVSPAWLFQPPVAKPGSVLRQRLQDRLAESAAARLVLVVAPAGWGKTSLLRDWWIEADGSCRAWLSVAAAHNDPAQFWSSVITALGTVSPEFGTAALEVPAGPEPGSVQPLISQLARMPSPVTLVLDDFHLISNPQVLRCFEFLVEHLPAPLNLMVAARSDPALPLARLRGRGELAEVRARELAFSEGEAAQLLNGTLGLALPPEHVRALRQRTGGWAAGLYLAGLALRERQHSDPVGSVRAHAGDNRHIGEYLATEVLGTLPPEVRSFLLRTCVLDRLCGSLCDAVTGSHDSRGLLEEIDRAQLFVVPLDNARHWYRYLPVFTETLRSQLDRSEPGLAALLHRRASAWHRQHGSVTDAISAAIAAGDLLDARELIAGHWDSILDDGQAEMLQSLLDQLPPLIVADDARTCLIRAFAAYYTDPPHKAEPWLAAAKAAPPGIALRHGPVCTESGVALIQAACRHAAGDLHAAETAAYRAAELELEAGTSRWRAAALARLGAALFWRGRHTDAEALLEQVIGPAYPAAGALTRLLARGSLAAIASRRQDHHAASRHGREAADLAACHGLQDHWATVTADLTTADLLADQGELAQAEAIAARALDHAQHHQVRPETAAALLCLATIHVRADRTTQADALIGQARDLIARCPASGILASQLTGIEQLAAPPSSMPKERGRSRRPDGLTGREAEVLELLTHGCTNQEIAAKLVVSIHTVQRHLQNAYRKVSVRNRADAAAYMARDGSQRGN